MKEGMREILRQHVVDTHECRRRFPIRESHDGHRRPRMMKASGPSRRNMSKLSELGSPASSRCEKPAADRAASPAPTPGAARDGLCSKTWGNGGEMLNGQLYGPIRDYAEKA